MDIIDISQIEELYLVIVWLHPRWGHLEIYDILGKVDDIDISLLDYELESCYISFGWYVKMTKWGEMCQYKCIGSEYELEEEDIYDIQTIRTFYNDLQKYRENIMEEP